MHVKQTNKWQRQKMLHTFDLHCAALPNLRLFILSVHHEIGNHSTIDCVKDNQLWGFTLVGHTEWGNQQLH